ncbi:MAG: molecular chaperone HtpG [Clostridia bacterium]|nr:molecular chaperone HtpG [Clostridia bacterium]
MALKQFKAESKRLLDLMINSIYTNKEIFLREIISNASDAIDKLHFTSLTDSNASREFEIRIDVDKNARTLTVSDNGVGMSEKELETNLGTIAKSGTLDFKKKNEKVDGGAEGLIGQFGVGFYSCFMVADEVTVLSKKYGEDVAHKWTSAGVSGYEITEAERETSGTTVTLVLKADDEDVKYSDYLEEYTIMRLVKFYSDYIRYPIRMQVERSVPAEDGKTAEKETVIETLNSMTPIWKRRKSEVKTEDYESFYMEKFGDYNKPARIITANIEGAVNYACLLFIPSEPPYDFYTKAFKKGLQLYSSGVLIMDNCEKLLPDYLGFVRGVVDSSDLSLNISREMLQQDRQLTEIAKSLEKKILSELSKWLKTEREEYEKFFTKFGMTLKIGAYEGFGTKIPQLKDLFVYYSTSGKFVTLKEYVGSMKEGQSDIYYGAGTDASSLRSLPQVTAVTAKGYDVLLMTDNVDEFVVKLMGEYDGKKLKSVSSEDLGIETEEEKKASAEKADSSKALLEEFKNALGTNVTEVRLSNMLGDYPSGLTAKGELSIEMAKVLSAMPGNEKIRAQYVLELNPAHPMFALAEKLMGEDKAKFGRLAVLLFTEAMLTVGINPENPAEFVKLINEFIR